MTDRIFIPLSPPPKDKVSSEETKAKLRAAMKGRKKSREHRAAACKPSKRVIQKRCGVRSHYSLTVDEVNMSNVPEESIS